MSHFDASTAVEVITFDFTKYGGGAGEIPEPTDEVLDNFFQGLSITMGNLKESVKDMKDLDATDPESVQAALSAVQEGDTMQKVSADLNVLIAGLTQGSPSEEDIQRLPFRVKQAFLGWLTGQFSPEGGTPTSKQ